jgi:hypothetical protein
MVSSDSNVSSAPLARMRAILVVVSLFATWACGVKSPPLPPLPVTPQQSDSLETRSSSPVPTASPEASTKKTQSNH